MKYTEQYLLKDEQIIYRAELHWAVYLPVIYTLICGLILGIIFGICSEETTIGVGATLFVWILLGIPVAISCLIAKKTSEFVLTNKRILLKFGFIKRTSFENLLPKIEGIIVDQSILGRMLDFGTIIISGVGGSKIPFHNIIAPLELRRAVQNQLEAPEKK